MEDRNGMFDVISQEMTNEQLVIRNDIKDFNVKSQLIVHESQEAIFFKNGQEIARKVGVMPEKEFVAILDANL